MEPGGHAARPLLVRRERLAETRVLLQSRKKSLAEDASIDLAGDVSAALPVFDIEAETHQFAHAVIEKHKGAGLAGPPGCRADEIVIPLRQTGPQRLASRVVDCQAISL